MMTPAANDDQFSASELTADPFMTWALRVMLRLRNAPPGATDNTLSRAILSEGAPSPAWAGALLDMLLTRPKG